MQDGGTERILAARRVARRVRLTVEVLGVYPRARWLLANRRLPDTLAALRPGGGEGALQDGDLHTAAFLGHAVTRVLDPLPLDSRCLIRALVLARMLDRRGIPGRLVIGADPGETFTAHAWIEVAGTPVLDPGPYGERRLAVF